MERFFSHYTFIYPQTYLSNHIVELSDNKIVSYFPYEKQISHTFFVSGLLILIPDNLSLSDVKPLLVENEVYASLIERGSILVRSFSV